MRQRAEPTPVVGGVGRSSSRDLFEDSGEHTGDKIGLDHVLPRAVVPELEARFYNLEAIPSKVNMPKSADIPGHDSHPLPEAHQKERCRPTLENPARRQGREHHQDCMTVSPEIPTP